jgi:hypothetical protein
MNEFTLRIKAMETTTTLVNRITSKISQLPPPKLYEILGFVEFLTWKERDSLPELTDNEAIINQLMDELITQGVPLLSDYAVSREGIYEEDSSLCHI